MIYDDKLFYFFVTPTQLQVFYFELGTYIEHLSNLIYLKTYNIFHYRELLIFLCLLITRNTLPLRLSLDFADINQHRFSNKCKKSWLKKLIVKTKLN